MFKRCVHIWELIDKWTDSVGMTWWEFYCKLCMEIRTVNNEKELRRKV